MSRKSVAVASAPNADTVTPAPRFLDSQEFFTQKEAAAYMRCAYWSIRAACYTGDLPCALVGKRFIIHITDLRVWFEKRKKDKAA